MSDLRTAGCQGGTVRYEAADPRVERMFWRSRSTDCSMHGLDVISFDGEPFNGFVRVDSAKTVVSIQVALDDCRIHGGYHTELETKYPRIAGLDGGDC